MEQVSSLYFGVWSKHITDLTRCDILYLAHSGVDSRRDENHAEPFGFILVLMIDQRQSSTQVDTCKPR